MYYNYFDMIYLYVIRIFLQYQVSTHMKLITDALEFIKTTK